MIPLQTYDVLEIGMGPAILLVSLLALLLWATVSFRNPLGVMAWGFTVLLFVLSALFQIGFELVWMMIAVTTMLTIVGVVARINR